MDHILPLELLNAGEWADVAEVHGELVWVGRMAELGLRTGCRIQILQGGSPCLLQINGTRLCLRGEQAMRILVKPIAVGLLPVGLAVEPC